MQQIRLAVLGFGNVGRALATLLLEKQDELGQRYGLAFSFSGGYTRSAGGWHAAPGSGPAAPLASCRAGGRAGGAPPAPAPPGAPGVPRGALPLAPRRPAALP